MAFVLVALSLVACSQLVGSPRVDGLPIGEPAACTEHDDCAREIAFARRWLDSATPGHAPIRSVEIHVPDYPLQQARSGGRTVVAVLRLEDGSTRALLLGCGVGIDPEPCGVMAPP